MTRDVLTPAGCGELYHDALGETTIRAWGAARNEMMQRVSLAEAREESYEPCPSCDVPQPVVTDGGDHR